MELIFIDNGLIGKGEHSYRLVKDVCQVLFRRQVRSRIFGCKILDPAIEVELGAVPHFGRSLYESVVPGPNARRLRGLAAFLRGAPVNPAAPSERGTWKVLNAAFERDLAALPGDVWQRDNVVVVPGISQNQLMGLVRCLIAKPQTDTARVICQLMFSPDWTPWGRNSVHGDQYYRKAFDLAAPLVGHVLVFTAENDAIAAHYRKRFGIAAEILPIPFGATREGAETRGRVRLGFFGYSKSDKGFHLLPRAIELCRRQGLDADFVIQIQHSGWEAATIEADRALRARNDVDLIDGVLNSDDFAAWTDRIDVMLLPYDPASFGLRGSGIFTESVAAGRPVVASAGTFAAKCIERGDAEGEIFAPHDSEQLAGAILRILPRLGQCRARAKKIAESFAWRHSPDAYVEVLLAHARKIRTPSEGSLERPSASSAPGRASATDGGQMSVVPSSLEPKSDP